LDPDQRLHRDLQNDREIGRATATDSRLKHGAQLLARNHPETAEATFREVLEAFPESEAAHSLLAMALADQARGRESLHAADRAIQLNPQLALAHAARACALEASGLVWEAEMEGRQAS
jgi:Tfp pilus assembly protein PilF